MIYFPTIYTQEHVDLFFVRAQNHDELTPFVQKLAQLPTMELQVDSILDNARAAEILDGCRKRMAFSLQKATIEKHKRVLKIAIFHFYDKILHSYNLVFSPITDIFDEEIAKLKSRIRATEAESTLFEKEKEEKIAEYKKLLLKWEGDLEDFIRKNEPFDFDVRTNAHKKKDEFVEFEFVISPSFMEYINRNAENFASDYRVELNKSKQ